VKELGLPVDAPVSVFGTPVDDVEWSKLSDASLFLGFNEIETVVSTISQGASKSFETLEKALDKYPRITSLQAYNSRLAIDGSEKAPLGEFFCLIGLLLEVREKFNEREQAAVDATKKRLGVSSQRIDADVILDYASDLDEKSAQRIATSLSPPNTTSKKGMIR
jgi:hypothetical protein